LNLRDVFLTINLAELHIVQQESRIERQEKLIESLEADGHAAMAHDARLVFNRDENLARNDA
jgi:hypothetical protein